MRWALMAQDSDLHFYSNEPPAPYPSLVRVLVRVVVRVELICLFLMKYLLFWPTDKMATRTISIMISSQRAKERVVYITRTTREKEKERERELGGDNIYLSTRIITINILLSMSSRKEKSLGWGGGGNKEDECWELESWKAGSLASSSPIN